MNNEAAQFKKMTETPVKPLIASLAVPTIISMLITAVYNTADTFFVAQISTEATAAVGPVFSLMMARCTAAAMWRPLRLVSPAVLSGSRFTGRLPTTNAILMR